MSSLRSVFDEVTAQRRKTALADHINYPKLPPILTESLVVHLIRRGKILPEFATSPVGLGGRVADIIINGGKSKIEVKGTTAMSWVTLGINDVNADHLVWIDFANYFTNIIGGPIRVIVFKNPGSYLKTGKPVLDRVLSLAGPNAAEYPLDIDQFLKE